MQSTRALVGICAALLAVTHFEHAAFAQQYPAKPVRMIIPFPPGGGSDTMGRALAHKLEAALGQRIVVDNRLGAAGSIGADLVAKAAADGYTVLLGSTSELTQYPNVNPSVPYDAVRDFAPISLIGTVPLVLVVHPSLPVKSVQELVALAKAQPGKLNGASSGVGSTNHLTLEMFKALAKVDILVVPFKGGSPAIASVMGGQTNMIFNTPGTLLGHVAAGKLRGLGVTSRERVDFVELPAIAETVPGFEATVWYGVYGPKTLPARLVQRWNESINRYLKSPAAQTHLKRSHMIAAGGTPADLAAFHKSETERWGAVVKAAGIEPQ